MAVRTRQFLRSQTDLVRRILNLAVLLPLFGVLAISFAIWGWLAQSRALDLNYIDVIYRSIGSVTLSTIYDSSNKWNRDWRIDLARTFGVTAFLLAATKVFARFLSYEISAYSGRFRKNHLLVVGDHPVAKGVVEAAVRHGVQVTWFANSEVPIDAIAGALIVPHNWNRHMAVRFQVDRAARSVVAFTNEVEQIAAVRDLRAVAALSSLPLIAIGGITSERVGDCVRAGADGVAVVRAILGMESPRDAARALRAASHRLQEAQAHRVPHRSAQDQCGQDPASSVA
jgi:hypothetical protein